MLTPKGWIYLSEWIAFQCISEVYFIYTAKVSDSTKETLDPMLNHRKLMVGLMAFNNETESSG